MVHNVWRLFVKPEIKTVNSTKVDARVNSQLTTEPLFFAKPLLPAFCPTVSLYALSILSFRVIVCCVCQGCVLVYFNFWSVGDFLKQFCLCVGKANSFYNFGLCVGLWDCKCSLLWGYFFIYQLLNTNQNNISCFFTSCSSQNHIFKII